MNRDPGKVVFVKDCEDIITPEDIRSINKIKRISLELYKNSGEANYVDWLEGNMSKIAHLILSIHTWTDEQLDDMEKNK